MQQQEVQDDDGQDDRDGLQQPSEDEPRPRRQSYCFIQARSKEP